MVDPSNFGRLGTSKPKISLFLVCFLFTSSDLEGESDASNGRVGAKFVVVSHYPAVGRRGKILTIVHRIEYVGDRHYFVIPTLS